MPAPGAYAILKFGGVFNSIRFLLIKCYPHYLIIASAINILKRRENSRLMFPLSPATVTFTLTVTITVAIIITMIFTTIITMVSTMVSAMVSTMVSATIIIGITAVTTISTEAKK